MDAPAARQPGPQVRPRPVVVAPGHEPRVDRLEVVGDLGPAAPRRLRAQPRAQRRVGDRAGELGDEGRLVAGLEEQAAAAIVEGVLVDLQARGDGDGPRGGGAAQQAGRGREPLGGGDQDVGRAQQRVDVLLAGVGEAHPAAHGGAQRRRGRRAARGDDRRLPGQLGVERAQRAQEEAQGRALLLDVEQAHRRRRRRGPGRPPGRRRPARGRRRRPGRPAPRAAASPRSRPAGRRGGPAPGAPASAPPGRRRAARAARGSHRRSARASGAARRSTRSARRGRGRGTGRARRARRGPRACGPRRSASRRPRGATGRAGSESQRLADGQDPEPPRRPRAARKRPSPPARTARRPSRTSAEDDEGATTATRCPRPASSPATARDVPVDLVAGLPRVRRDLGDRQAPGAAHRGQDRPTHDERPASAGRSARRRWRRGR